jgi:hypothetical protein
VMSQSYPRNDAVVGNCRQFGIHVRTGKELGITPRQWPVLVLAPVSTVGTIIVPTESFTAGTSDAW